MKKTMVLALLAASHALLPATVFAQAQQQPYRIDHLEPSSWWVGMQSNKLQLMVHGKQIADLEPSLAYPGVQIAAVTRGPNRNYLFIDLVIAPDAKPGTLDLVFKNAGKSVHYPYALQARAANSAQRIGFNSSDVIYEVMPDRFANGNPGNDNVAGMTEQANRGNRDGRHGGDLQGIAEHLDYIAAMGYTQLWPTPLLESNMHGGSYHGYASTDHYHIDPRYGSNEDYRRLVAQARGKGIGVIQDVVLNHIGSEHWWMRDMPMPDWITNQGKFTPTEHHRVAQQDPYGSAADKRNFTEGWFVKNMPDLNQANPYVANYLVQNAIWWIEYAGLSGLRVDTYSYSEPAFLSEWSRRVMAEYPRLNLVGEEWSPHIPIVARWQEGKQNFDGYVSHMPSMMDFPLTDVLRRSLAAPDDTYNSLTDLYEALSQDYLYANPGNMVLFEGNHDMSRLFSELNEDEGLLRMATAFVLTAPRVPQFYAGTEILMTSTVKGRDDASYRVDFPGGWAGDKVNAFTGAGLTPAQAATQAYLKKLLNWRKGATVIHHGKTMHFGPESNVYVFFRYDGSKKVMVVMNKNKAETKLSTDRFAEMLKGAPAGVDVVSGKRYALDGVMTLPARSALVLEVQQ
jgi:glycosidase